MTYGELADRSSQLAAWLQSRGVDRGDRVLLMLGNQVELWETILAGIKLGAVIIPASTLLAPADLRDRVERGHVRHVVARGEDAPKFADVPGDWTRIAVGDAVEGWLDYGDSLEHLRLVHARGRDPGRRAAAALLHVGHHGAAQAGRAHPRVVPDRAPLDDVLDRPAAGRRAPQHLLAGLGQARLEQRLRAAGTPRRPS